MKWRWSLSKQAAENELQPPVPLEQPKQQIPVAPAPVVQQPQQIQNQQPVQPAGPAPTNKIDLFKYNNPQIVKDMNGFIMAHLPNAQKTPDNAPYRKEPKKWIESFKASAVSWKVFQELYYTITKGTGETDGQFLQRVTYEKPFDGVDAEELGLPEFIDPEEQNDNADKFGDFKNKIADTEKADKLVRPFLEEIADSFAQENRDILSALSQYNNPNKANQVAPSAQTMGFAPFEFFLGNGKGVSMKKWKIFFTENPDLLPEKVTARMDAGLAGSVKEAIDYDIISTSSESPGEMPSIINKLQEISQSTSFIDPSALSSLDSLPEDKKAVIIHQLMDKINEGNDEQSLLLKYIINAARTLASMKDKQNQSTDMALSEGGASVASITKDEKALDPAKMLPKMADSELLIVDQIWKHFIQNHKDTIIQLRDAVDEGSGLVMLKALAEVKENPKGILDEAVHSAFSGFHEMKKDGEVMETWNKWIDLFIDSPQMLPQGMQGTPQQIQENSKELLPSILKALDDPQTAEAVKAHVYKSGYAYIQQIFRDRTLDRQQGLKDLIPNVGNIKTLNRIGKMAYGYLYREFMARIAAGAKQTGTAARTYSLLKARVDSMSKSLYRLLNTDEPIWLSDDKAVYRNAQGTIIIGDGYKYDRKAKKSYWKSELPLTDENFDDLQSMMDIEDWVPQAIDTMRVQYDKHGEAMKKLQQPSFLAKSENKVKEINGQNVLIKTKKDNIDATNITLFADRQRTQQIHQDNGNFQRQQKKSILYPLNDNIYQSMPDVVYVSVDLADGTKSDFVHNKLGATYAQANAEHAGKTQGDYLQGYRSEMGKRAGALREGLGMSVQDLAARIKSKKKVDEVARKGGTRLRGKHLTTEQFIESFEKGQPVLFGEGDLEELAAAMGVDHKEFYAPSNLYDQQNKDDLTDLAETLYYSYGTYGSYLLHKQRECVRRKTMHDIGNQKTMWYFLTLTRVPQVFSSDSPATVSDRRKGKMLSELSDGRPVGLSGGNLQERQEKARQNLEFINPKKARDPNAKPGDKALLETPDLYEYSGGGNDKYLNNDINLRKHYLPNSEHPLGMEQREYAPDLDKLVKNDDKNLLTDPATGEPKTLEQWKEHTTTTLRNRAESKEPEIVQKQMQDEIDAGKSPVEIANKLIEKTWKGNDKVKPTLEMLTQRVNDFNKKNGGKQFTPEEYAQKYCEDHIKSEKFFRDEAQKKLSTIEGGNLSPSEMLEAYVPARVRRNWPYSQMPFKRQEFTPDEMKNIGEGDKPEQIARLQQEKGDLDTALSIVKERTGVEGEQALSRLTGNMRKLNKYRTQNGLPSFNSVEEYAKHFVGEAIELEKYKRDKVKGNTETLNAPTGKLDPSTKSKLRERLSRDERRIITAMKALNKLGDMQRKSMSLGISSLHIATLADQIADNVIRNLYVPTASSY